MHAMACRPVALPATPRKTKRGRFFFSFRLLPWPFLAASLATRA